jgi:hypothetical protein
LRIRHKIDQGPAQAGRQHVSSPRYGALASSSHNGTVQLWDPVSDPLTGNTGRMTGVAFGTSGNDGCCWPPAATTAFRLWDPAAARTPIGVGLVTTSMSILALASTSNGAIYAATSAGIVAMDMDWIMKPIGANYRVSDQTQDQSLPALDEPARPTADTSGNC